MNVWRKQTVRYLLNGKQVGKGTLGAKAKREESKRFYGTLTLATGKRKQQPLTEERDTSETLLRRLQTSEDTKRANGADRFHDDRLRSLSEFLAEYETYLKAKANAERYVSQAIARCRKVINATKAKTIADLESSRIVRMVATWRQRKSRPLSLSTANDYLIAVKAFSHWLYSERRTPDDPLVGLRRMNTETDRKHVRRALSDSELETLLLVTHKSPKTYRGDDWHLTGADRSMLYRVAAFTGLRASELASLTKASFDLEAMTWTVAARHSKNRKTTTLPLSPALAERLRSWFAGLNRDVLFHGSWANRGRAGMILKRDLKRAGIDYRDASGRVVDFHALRYTFITSLAKRGVHPAKAQRLARHSTITLTMDVYTSLDLDDLREAVAGL